MRVVGGRGMRENKRGMSEIKIGGRYRGGREGERNGMKRRGEGWGERGVEGKEKREKGVRNLEKNK